MDLASPERILSLTGGDTGPRPSLLFPFGEGGFPRYASRSDRFGEIGYGSVYGPYVIKGVVEVCLEESRDD